MKALVKKYPEKGLQNPENAVCYANCNIWTGFSQMKYLYMFCLCAVLLAGGCGRKDNGKPS